MTSVAGWAAASTPGAFPPLPRAVAQSFYRRMRAVAPAAVGAIERDRADDPEQAFPDTACGRLAGSLDDAGLRALGMWTHHWCMRFYDDDTRRRPAVGPRDRRAAGAGLDGRRGALDAARVGLGRPGRRRPVHPAPRRRRCNCPRPTDAARAHWPEVEVPRQRRPDRLADMTGARSRSVGTTAGRAATRLTAGWTAHRRRRRGRSDARQRTDHRRHQHGLLPGRGRGPYDLRPGPVFDLAAGVGRGRSAAADLLPRPGRRRPAHLVDRRLRRVRRHPVPAVAPGAVPDAERRGRPRPPARPGRDLGRRRQRGQPGRGVAGARPRRDPARVLAGRRGAGRRLRRLDLLARRRCHRQLRPPAARLHRRPGLAAVRQRGALRQRGPAPPAACTSWSATARSRPATAPTTGSAWSTGAPGWSRRSPTAEGVSAYEVSRGADGSVREAVIAPRLLG